MAYTITAPSAPNSDSFVDISNYLANYSETIVNAGNAYVNDLGALKNIDFSSVGDLPTLGYSYINFDAEIAEIKASKPSRPVLSLAPIQDLVNKLAALVVPSTPVLDLPDGTVPELSATAPTVVLPPTPVSTVGPAPNDVPEITDVPIPPAPVIVFPVAPTFEEFALPAPPSLSLVEFDAEPPVNNLGPFTQTFYWAEPAYDSDLREPLEQKLLYDLLYGGYGIEPYDEQGLWGRARDRAVQDAEAELDEIRSTAAATGMPMPPGALYARMSQARKNLSVKLAEINRDIALKRSDLYVENRKFTIEQVQRFEEQSIQLYNAIAERSLNYAKATVELGIAIYDCQLRSFQASLEAYKTEAEVFEAQIRAELAKVEIYKAQVEAANLSLEMQRTKVALYNAQLESIKTVVEVYRSQLMASNIMAEIQKTKLEAFQIEVQAYATTVRAEEAKFQMYEASLKGELAKLNVYNAQIEAYNSTLKGLEMRSRITLQSNDALIKQYMAGLQNYDSRVETLVKQMSAVLDSTKTGAAIYESDVSAYTAFANAMAEAGRLRVRNQEMNNEWNQAALTSKVNDVKFSLEQLDLTVANLKDINKWGAEFYRTGFASAISGINGLTVKTAE